MADADSKRCQRCGEQKSLDSFSRNSSSKDGLRGKCKPCRTIESTEWIANNRDRYNKRIRDDRAVNPEKYKAWANAYRNSDPERYKEIKTNWLKKNPEKRKEISSRYSRSHKAQAVFLTRKRQAATLQAVPLWADADSIQRIYEDAAKLSKSTGIKYEVDHIVPLRGKTVCGLHCEANLQILERRENRSKSNRFWPDMPD